MQPISTLTDVPSSTHLFICTSFLLADYLNVPLSPSMSLSLSPICVFPPLSLSIPRLLCLSPSRVVESPLPPLPPPPLPSSNSCLQRDPLLHTALMGQGVWTPYLLTSPTELMSGVCVMEGNNGNQSCVPSEMNQDLEKKKLSTLILGLVEAVVPFGISLCFS